MRFIKLFRQCGDKAKIVVRKIMRKGYYPQVEYKCQTRYFGSAYGGWEVAKDFINGDSIIYSFGVGEDISFDMGLIKTYGINVYAFDPTPNSIEWVKRQDVPSKFIFHPYGIACFDGVTSFFPPENPSFVSYKMSIGAEKEQGLLLPVKKLDTIVKDHNHNRIDLLKMDIEGAEYDVIAYIKKSRIRPNQILVEFHHRWPAIGVDKTIRAVKILSGMGYKLFYITSNDEFGFVFAP